MGLPQPNIYKSVSEVHAEGIYVAPPVSAGFKLTLWASFMRFCRRAAQQVFLLRCPTAKEKGRNALYL